MISILLAAIAGVCAGFYTAPQVGPGLASLAGLVVFVVVLAGAGAVAFLMDGD